MKWLQLTSLSLSVSIDEIWSLVYGAKFRSLGLHLGLACSLGKIRSVKSNALAIPDSQNIKSKFDKCDDKKKIQIGCLICFTFVFVTTRKLLTDVMYLSTKRKICNVLF